MVLSFVTSFLFEELPFSKSLSVGPLVTNSFRFSSSENVDIFPPFLRDNFSRCRIHIWQFFSLNTWKIMCHFLLSIVSDKKSIVIWIGVFLSVMCHLSAFKTFFCSFWKCNYDLSWRRFLWLYPLWCLLSLNVKEAVFTKFGKISTIVSSNTLSTSLFLLLLELWWFKYWIFFIQLIFKTFFC